jgi:hypothetical protein
MKSDSSRENCLGWFWGTFDAGIIEKDREEPERKLGRRASIEPRIGHLKACFRLGRKFLKGIYGDMVNVILAGSAVNLVNWMGRFLLSISERLFRSSKLLETLREALTGAAPKFPEAF